MCLGEKNSKKKFLFRARRKRLAFWCHLDERSVSVENISQKRQHRATGRFRRALFLPCRRPSPKIFLRASCVHGCISVENIAHRVRFRLSRDGRMRLYAAGICPDLAGSGANMLRGTPGSSNGRPRDRKSLFATEPLAGTARFWYRNDRRELLSLSVRSREKG